MPAHGTSTSVEGGIGGMVEGGGLDVVGGVDRMVIVGRALVMEVVVLEALATVGMELVVRFPPAGLASRIVRVMFMVVGVAARFVVEGWVSCHVIPPATA
jgi:hypothetical protein